MDQSATLTKRFSPRASLATIGLKLQELKLFDSISQTVNIPQKIVKHRPAEKLYDTFITILAGARGLNESGTRLRSDEALQRAFGRSTCALVFRHPRHARRLHSGERLAHGSRS